MALQRAVYRPRDAEHTVLHQVVAEHLEAFLTCIPTFCAADMIRITRWGCAGFSGCNSTATRDNFGTAAFSSSSSFGPRSTAASDRPVMLPPGRARLAQKPSRPGQTLRGMTPGLSLVAVCSLQALPVAPL